MSQNLETTKFSANEKTIEAIRKVAPNYTRLKGDFTQTKQDVIDGKNLGEAFPETNSKQEIKNYSGFKVYVLGEDKSDDVIVYLHGGAYLFGLYPNQVGVMDTIAQKTGKQVYVVDYGLPIKYDWSHAYNLLGEIYRDIDSQNKNLILIGDSAGAGLILGYVEYLNKQNLKAPIKQVLISPWLDITMSNSEAKKYEDDDVFLSIDSLIEAGEMWANGLDTRDYRLSPIFGDLNNIPETLITTGTSEVMYPDILNLSETLANFETKVKLIICEGLFHAYPYFPVEESKYTIEQIIEFLA